MVGIDSDKSSTKIVIHYVCKYLNILQHMKCFDIFTLSYEGSSE